MVYLLNDFFHYGKHGKKEILDLFNNLTEDYKKWCPFNHDKTIKVDIACYASNEEVKELNRFLESYFWLFSYLEIRPNKLDELKVMIDALKNPLFNQDIISFEYNLKNIKGFIETYQDLFFEKAKKFTCIESIRVWEAVRCFKNDCYMAAVILSVSAIESRLHTLIKGKNKKIYQSQIENAPLGKIISLRDPSKFIENTHNQIKQIITKIIPERHLPLIKLLNTYRIFSAHPKNERIEFNIASSILNLSFSFLLDERLDIPKKLCNEKGMAPAS